MWKNGEKQQSKTPWAFFILCFNSLHWGYYVNWVEKSHQLIRIHIPNNTWEISGYVHQTIEFGILRVATQRILQQNENQNTYNEHIIET